MDAGKIEKLLLIKDKSKASKADRDCFMNSWLSYVAEYGFNDMAETFLYDGFFFQGFLPFMTWLLTIQDRREAIEKLLAGKCFYRNNSTTFKAMFHLLALLFEKLPNDKELVKMIIERIPEVSTNKENKQLGDITKSIDKYFVQSLSSEVTLPNLEFLGLPQQPIDDFRRIMVESLKVLVNEENVSSEKLSKMAKMEKWLSGKEMKSEEIISASNQAGITNKKTPATILSQQNIINTHTENICAKPCDEENKPYSWQDGISIVTNAIKQLEKKHIQLQIEFKNICEENEKLKNKLDDTVKIMEHEAANCEKHKDEIRRLSDDVLLFQQQIAELEKTIAENNSEITERAKIEDLLRRDRSKLTEEMINRLSAKLRPDYQDFQDAEKIPMNIDLGENMRLQLKSVFEILKKSGLNLS